MNILYTITSYPPSIGGAQLYIHELAKRAAQEHSVNVVSFFNNNRNDWLLGTTLRVPSKENRYIYENVNVRQISFTKLEKFMMFPFLCTYYFNKRRNISALSRFIEKKLHCSDNKPDLVHNVRVGREPLSYASYNLARSLRIPFIFTPLHHPKWSHWFYREYQGLYRKADGLFALTPHEKELFKNLGVKEENIFITGTGPVVSNEFNPERFKKTYNISGNMVLFIAQGYKYKGIFELLKAAKIVFKHIKNINFVFIGPHTEYSKKIFKKIKDTRILHLGKVDFVTKTDALSACDIFCLPSRQESFGAVFLEAWCFEKPVIGLDIPQVRFIIKDGVNGYLVPPKPEIIADRIINLLSNVDLCKKLGRAGRKLVEDNFTWDILYKKTIKAYEEILVRFKDK
jgi:glycosyltransferase involved in cell wall biosynthesis